MKGRRKRERDEINSGLVRVKDRTWLISGERKHPQRFLISSNCTFTKAGTVFPHYSQKLLELSQSKSKPGSESSEMAILFYSISIQRSRVFTITKYHQLFSPVFTILSKSSARVSPSNEQLDGILGLSYPPPPNNIIPPVIAIQCTHSMTIRAFSIVPASVPRPHLR